MKLYNQDNLINLTRILTKKQRAKVLSTHNNKKGSKKLGLDWILYYKLTTNTTTTNTTAINTTTTFTTILHLSHSANILLEEEYHAIYLHSSTSLIS